MFFNRIRDTLTYLSSSTCLHFIMNTVIDDDSQFKTHLIDVKFAGHVRSPDHISSGIVHKFVTCVSETAQYP